ncbi:MAG: Aklanonic acid methyltransferase DnrC [Candidatus Anoxychlamydiales bacterium]|nr:Aklanonic acid methyltransferase DnrC [Candidatus Anoxychlamydiales bacterium]
MDYYYQLPNVELVQYVAVNQKATKSDEDVKREVRSVYRNAAKGNNQNNSSKNNCCGSSTNPNEYAKKFGYTEEELESIPQECNMGLGCGNPQNIASLKEGESVLDLGAGGGIDVFLAAKKVGPNGKVYGVDMTPEMLSKARDNALKGNYKNVEFLLGEIEHLPLPNNSIDAIISNCVVNLSTNKAQVFKESFRVLKDGGRIAISDMVAYKPLPKEMINNKELYSNCISGASTIDELKNSLSKAGFVDIVIETQKDSRQFIKDWVPGSDAENYVISAKIKAVKPRGSK